MATLKRPKIGFQDQLLLNAGQKYCRMLQGTHSAIFRPSVSYNLSFVLSIFEWPFYTGFTVVCLHNVNIMNICMKDLKKKKNQNVFIIRIIIRTLVLIWFQTDTLIVFLKEFFE